MKCKEQIKSINLTELGVGWSFSFFLYKLKNCSQITNDISLHQHQISNFLCANFQKILYLCFRCICVCFVFIPGFLLMVLDCDLCDDLFNYENLIPKLYSQFDNFCVCLCF